MFRKLKQISAFGFRLRPMSCSHSMFQSLPSVHSAAASRLTSDRCFSTVFFRVPPSAVTASIVQSRAHNTRVDLAATCVDSA